jgi:hypothetical protein
VVIDDQDGLHNAQLPCHVLNFSLGHENRNTLHVVAPPSDYDTKCKAIAELRKKLIFADRQRGGRPLIIKVCPGDFELVPEQLQFAADIV